MRPLVVVGDVHLGHRECSAVASDLARLVTSHPGHEIILNGDTFNLTCDPRDRDPAISAVAMIEAHPALRAALCAHLAGGHALTMVAGNHDAAIHLPEVRAALLALLTAGNGGELQIEPWIARRGGVHIEHGHVYDPGNSPTHPLAVPSYRTEPVGIKITRRFVGRYDAWEVMADRSSATTRDNLTLLVDHFGARAPIALLRYAALLLTINAETAIPSRLVPDRCRGDAALPAYAARGHIAEDMLRALLEGRHRPMHFSFRDTFMRFGFDALLAILAIPAGALVSLMTGHVEGVALSAGGLGYLAAARRSLERRRANHMPDDLRAGAALVQRITDATVVIFGHTHQEDELEGYLNLGAFGDPPRGARPYVRVGENGTVERRRLPSA